MKELKEIGTVELKEYGVNVKPYLTYDQIQEFVNVLADKDMWADREQTIDILLIHFATDITDEESEKIGHDGMVRSGLIDAVKAHVINFSRVYEALEYTESVARALNKIAKDMPTIMEPIKKVMERGNKSSNK